MKAVTGNTYPVKDKIKALGGQWDKDRKLWLVPDDKFQEAEAAVRSAAAQKELSKEDIIAIAVRNRGGTPGICSSCGAVCRKPYDECWDCREERDMGY